jgi:hypothetical protein
MSKNILIITFDFFPSKNIGAYRWSGISKFFIKEGHSVSVICSNESIKEPINHNGINIIPFSFKKKKRIDFKIGLLTKLFNKFIQICYYIFYQTYYQDKVASSKRSFKSYLSEFINDNAIDIVVSTGPPHMLNYYTAQVLDEFKDIKFIMDIRDLWTEGIVYSLEKTPYYIKHFSLKQELKSFERANKILVVNKKFKEYYEKKFPSTLSEKIQVVPHCFDLDDYSENAIDEELSISEDKISFIYGGRVIGAYVTYLESFFLPYLSQLKVADFSKYSKLRMDFYGDCVVLKKAVKKFKIDDIFNFYKPLERKRFNKRALKYDYCLNMLGESWFDFVTTKMITYLPLNQPIVLFSEEGEASKFVRDNRIGCVVNTSNYREIFDNLLNEEQFVSYSSDMDISKYSFENNAKYILKNL